jgi:molybdopterin synthase catalytic subunit
MIGSPFEADPMLTFSETPIDAAALRAEFTAHTAGALVVFEGVVRNFNDGRKVIRLEYEATPALAIAEYEAIVQEAARAYPLVWVRCVHRIGPTTAGDTAIWLGVATAHRAEAFEACRYLIDHFKARVPVWKKEHYEDGAAEWVHGP